jgi:uncharacterized protein (TIGR01777 family)
LKIVIPGGSGHMGTILATAFHARGDEVVVLGRSPITAPWRFVQWDARVVGDWAAELEGVDAVINLAGRSVNCRYNEKNRRDIMNSRVDSARAVGAAIADCRQPPRAWLQMSTATIYAHRFDAANDEKAGIIGGMEDVVPETWRFSIDVATSWERAVDEADTPQTRKLKLRTAVLMSPESGGPFDLLMDLVRFGVGGTVGDGRQYISWIHYRDFVSSVLWLIDHTEIDGIVNLAAPEPRPNRDFMRILRKAHGIGFGIPAPGPILALGAFMMRSETELALKSRRVVPGRLLDAGFQFEFPNWEQAAADLTSGWRSDRTAKRKK